MSEELKPCPFCGSKDIVVRRVGTARVSCIVGCEDCACELESSERGSGYDWNNRVSAKGARMKCIKCSGETITTKYHKKGGGTESRTREIVCSHFDNNTDKKEHLHYYCVCNYDWTGPCADAEAAI